jgi:ABC-type transport system substrate-binding protein/methyl-accepting chemotaxis protein
MFFKRKKEIELASEEISLTIADDKSNNNVNKQIYQGLVSKRVFNEAEEALDVTEVLLKSVEDINIEMEKHSEHIMKTVDVSSEVGAFSEEVNAGVDETMRVIEDTLEKARNGQVSVNNAIASIEAVQNTVANMKDVILELAEKSNKIKGIVDTIKGIAKTTHLLSLNANIEAARAGESGKGFAVVAGEVKKLAENSSKSADEIDYIISEITKVTEETLDIILQGTEQVTKSTTVAENAGEALNEMMESVEKTKAISEQISASVRQQAEKNQHLISVIDDMVQVAEKVKSNNENISVNADRQKAVLNNLKGTITSLTELSTVENIEGKLDKTEFKMASAGLKTLDPAMATEINDSIIISAMNLGLVQFGPGTEVIGAIAKNWHVESDNLTWNFNLRKNLKFHNGRIITASDVKATFERLLSKELDSPNRWFLAMVKGANAYYENKTKEVSGIIVTGEYSLKIVLEYAYSSFINNLAHCSCSILPKENFNLIEAKPIGAGAFKFVTWDKESHELILEKNSNYVVGEALVDNIKVVCDVEDQFEAFEQGKIDYMEINASNINKVKAKGYKIDLTQCIGLRMIAFNYRSSNPLIKNKVARQAINYCIDKNKIINESLNGFVTPLNGAFPTSILNNSAQKGYTYNLNKAKELLRKSGVEAKTITLQVAKSGGNKGFHEILARILKENLREIGIELRVNEVDGAKYYAEETFFKCDLFTYGWLGDSGTADNFIEPLIDINNSSNRSRYNNPVLLELLEKAKKTRNPYKNRELLCKIEDVIVEDAAWIPLCNICVSYTHRSKVKGLRVHPLNSINFSDMWIE